MFKKIELWLVLLLGIFGIIGTIGFGALILEQQRGNHRFGALGKFAVDVAGLPRQVSKIMANKDPRIALRTKGFDGKSGWSTYGPDADKVSGFLLLSRFDGDSDSAVVELVDLSDRTVRYRWQPDADVLLANSRRGTVSGNGNRWNRQYFEAVHPVLLGNGDLVIKDHESPLIRIDACNQAVWSIDHHVFHHSTNLGPDGNIWSITHIDPPNPKNGPFTIEDGIAEVSPDGKMLTERSLIDILIKNGFQHLLFATGGYHADATHANDVQPVLADGPFWKKGDLFISLHNLSMIILYRPSTDEIIWSKAGPWMAQHDVDIINDHTIAVFNNNAYDRGLGWRVLGNSDVLFYDFATGKTTSPYSASFAAQDVATLSEGLFDFTPSGHLVIEEENSGRLLVLDQTGKLVADFINRSADGRIFTLSWVRVIDRAAGQAALAALASRSPC